MINKNILIRCDASQTIGLGHITRCLVLANEFKKSGNNIIFAIKNNELAIEKIKEQQFDMLISNDDNFDYFKWIVDIIEQQKIDIFIGDIRDGFPIELISYMKNKNILTVAIDEPSDYAKECDICFYPPHAIIDKTKYKGKVYQGLEYVILRPEFYEKFEKVKNKIPNVLVMMGGTDAYNLTLPVIKKLDKKDEYFEISVILSEKNKDFSLLNEFKRTANHKINIYNKIDNMAYFLNNIDYAVISFGASAYEMLLMTIPSVHVCLNDEHYEASNYFSLNGYAERYYMNAIHQIVINKKEIKKDLVNCNNIEKRILNATF